MFVSFNFNYIEIKMCWIFSHRVIAIYGIFKHDGRFFALIFPSNPRGWFTLFLHSVKYRRSRELVQKCHFALHGSYCVLGVALCFCGRALQWTPRVLRGARQRAKVAEGALAVGSERTTRDEDGVRPLPAAAVARRRRRPGGQEEENLRLAPQGWTGTGVRHF